MSGPCCITPGERAERIAALVEDSSVHTVITDPAPSSTHTTDTTLALLLHHRGFTFGVTLACYSDGVTVIESDDLYVSVPSRLLTEEAAADLILGALA